MGPASRFARAPYAPQRVSRLSRKGLRTSLGATVTFCSRTRGAHDHEQRVASPRGGRIGTRARYQAAVMLPRNGFLHESRSSPIIGPGLGRPMSPRFEPIITCGPDTEGYDLPNVALYKMNGSASVSRFGRGFGRVTKHRIEEMDANLQRMGGAAVDFHSVPPLRTTKAPRIGPGPGRPMSPRLADMSSPLGTDAMYDLPPPEVRSTCPRQPRTTAWDPKLARFAKEKTFECDEMYDLPPVDTYQKINSACVTRLGSSGPRIDPLLYKHGEGADRFYDIPPVEITRPWTPTVHRFGAQVIRPEVITPIRIPSQEAPPWLGRLSAYKPRPRTPFFDKNGAHQILSNAMMRTPSPTRKH